MGLLSGSSLSCGVVIAAFSARRAAEMAGAANANTDLLKFVTDGFTNAAMAKVGTSAIESRRLGYLLEHYGLADAPALEPLRSMLTATYQRLDPLLPAEGAFLSRWRLRLNVTPEELDAVRLG